MRCEYVDSSEFVRRLNEEIYDKVEFGKALAWVKANCPEGKDPNPPELRFSRQRLDQDWETVVKMALIARDLMVGNPRLDEMGYGEEALGHNALAGGFQGQRQWTDHFPNGDFMEAILNSSFDWNGIRQPYVVATENDALNGISMLFGHLLTGRAQIFSDVRTYWSPEAVKRVTGYELTGDAAGGFLHLINSGSAALDGTGEQTEAGQPVIKPWWEVSGEEAARCLDATVGARAASATSVAAGSLRPCDARRHARDDVTAQPGQGAGAGVADRRRVHRGVAGRRAPHAQPAHRSDLADHLVRPNPDRRGTL